MFVDLLDKLWKTAIYQKCEAENNENRKYLFSIFAIFIILKSAFQNIIYQKRCHENETKNVFELDLVFVFIEHHIFESYSSIFDIFGYWSFFFIIVLAFSKNVT